MLVRQKPGSKEETSASSCQNSQVLRGDRLCRPVREGKGAYGCLSVCGEVCAGLLMQPPVMTMCATGASDQAILACQTAARHTVMLRCSVPRGVGPDQRERSALCLRVWLALLLAFTCLL